jgi:hypothetical protein
MPFTTYVTAHYRCVEADGFGAGGHITRHQVATVQLTGASAYHSDVQTLSAGVSNRAIGLAPLAASLPGSRRWLQANQPLDLRLNSGAWLCHIAALLRRRRRMWRWRRIRPGYSLRTGEMSATADAGARIMRATGGEAHGPHRVAVEWLALGGGLPPRRRPPQME